MWCDSLTCDMTHDTCFVHSHDSFVCVTHLYVMRLAHVWLDSWNLTHSYSWLVHMCDSFICDLTRSCVTWLMTQDSFICDVTHSHVTWLMTHDSFTFVTDAYFGLIHMWRDLRIRYMTYDTWLIHSRESFICEATRSCVTWLEKTGLIRVRDSYVTRLMKHDSFIVVSHSYVMWLTHMWHDSWHMTRSFSWLIHMCDSFICEATRSCETWLEKTGLIRVRDSFVCMTHSYVKRLTHMWHDSWHMTRSHSLLMHILDSYICDGTRSYVTRLMRHDSFIFVTHSYFGLLIRVETCEAYEESKICVNLWGHVTYEGTPVKFVWKLWGLPWKCVEILEGVFVLSPISSVCGCCRL